MINSDEENFSAADIEDDEDDLLDEGGDDDSSDEDEDDEDLADEDGAEDKGTKDAEGEDDEGEAEKTPEQKRREENRLKRQQAKARRRRKEQESQIKLQEMQAKLNRSLQELDGLKNKALRYEYDEVDTELNKGLRGIELAKQAMAKAEQEEDAIAYNKASLALQQASNHTQQMRRIKESMLLEAQRSTEAKPGLSVRAETYGRQWLSQNEHWMKKGGRNLTVAVSAIDADIMAQGYNPDTPEYWKALSRACRGTWPHLFQGKKPALKSGTSSPPPKGDQRKTAKDSESKLPKSFQAKLDEAGLEGDRRKRAISTYWAERNKNNNS